MADTLDPPGDEPKPRSATVLGFRVLIGEVEDGLVWAILPEGTPILDMKMHKGLTIAPWVVRVPYELVVRVCAICEDVNCEHESPPDLEDEPA